MTSSLWYLMSGLGTAARVAFYRDRDAGQAVIGSIFGREKD